MVVLLPWQQVASVLSFVAVMAPLVAAVTVAVPASLPLAEDKMPLPPALAYHTSADTNNKLLYYLSRGEGEGRKPRGGEG